MNIDTKGWRILLVDDEPDNLIVVTKVLSMSGIDVQTAEDGIQGLDTLKRYQPTAILLDISMPRMDGFEMHKQVRQQSQFDSVPIVALTALAMQGERERIREAGFDGYISKPFDIFDLVPAINRAIQKRRSPPPEDTQ